MRKIFAVKRIRDEHFKNNWATHHLSGKVNRVEQFQYYNMDVTDTTSVPFALKEYLSFNKDGNLAERTIYDSLGFDSRNVYMYDPTGKCIRIGNYAEDGAFRFTQYYDFDTAGNLLATGERHVDGGIVNERLFEYDEYGEVVKLIKTGDDPATMFKNQYDEEGLLVQQETFYSERKYADWITLWKYDSLGNTIDEKRYLDNYTLYSSVSTSYNRQRRPLRMVKVDDKGRSVTIECRYDANGNVVEEYQRDSHTGRRIEFYKHRYEYDKTGNWTKSALIDGSGHKVQVTIRNIRYYPE